MTSVFCTELRLPDTLILISFLWHCSIKPHLISSGYEAQQEIVQVQVCLYVPLKVNIHYHFFLEHLVQLGFCSAGHGCRSC